MLNTIPVCSEYKVVSNAVKSLKVEAHTYGSHRKGKIVKRNKITYLQIKKLDNATVIIALKVYVAVK